MRRTPRRRLQVMFWWCLVTAFVLRSELAGAVPNAVVWTLDNLRSIGGFAPEILGGPKTIDGATVFDGVRDGLLIEANPLASADAFTVEILFEPAEGGGAAQRFLHIEDNTGARLLVETRLNGQGGWWLDTFLKSSRGERPLIDPTKIHPTNRWYWVALRFDGKQMSAFVDGEKETSGTVTFPPMAGGRLSIGVRQNRVYWFKGAIREVRFTRESLPEAALQRNAQPVSAANR